MKSPEETRRKRVRLLALVAVLVLAAGLRYVIASSPPTYLESATVVFSLPKSQTAPNAYIIFASSLITSGEAMSEIMQSPQAQRKIREAGGTAKVSLALVNLYDEEYPNYGVPLATLTVSALDAAGVHRTFAIASRLLHRLLAGLQSGVGVRPHNRISAQIIGDTGVAAQPGSPKRVLAGLMILALVTVSALWNALDRRNARRQCPGRAPGAGYRAGSLPELART
jgi:hypothetical protein